MRVRIEAEPGELEARADDLVKTIRRMSGAGAGCDCDDDLEKAALKGADQVPRKLDLPALQGGVDRAAKAVHRIQAKMVRDMLGVLKTAR